MGVIALLRLLALLLVLWIVRRLLRPPAAPGAGGSSRRSSEAAHMVQCRMCRTHVPQSEAIREGADWFCSTRHRDQFEQQS